MRYLFFSLLFIFSLALHAQATGAASAKTNQVAGVDWTFHGDAYYLYNTNTPVNQNDGSAGYAQNGYRRYDVAHNSFELNDIGFTLKRDLSAFSLFAQFDFGTQADIVNGVTDGRNVSQAYISIHTPELQGWLLELGKFYSHVGYETVLAKNNWNYSRSLSFMFGQPTWHVGARAIAPSNGPLKMSFFVLNGEGQADMKDNNKGKTLGAQVKFMPALNINLTYNGVWGPEKDDNSSDYTMIHNVIGEYQHNDDLKFAADLTYGRMTNEHDFANTASNNDNKSIWTGIALYGYITLTPTMYLSPRFEFFKAEEDAGTLGMTNGANPKDETVNSFTFTFGQTLGDGLGVRYEFRRDSSDNDNAFAEDSGVGTDNKSDEQLTATVALLFQI